MPAIFGSAGAAVAAAGTAASAAGVIGSLVGSGQQQGAANNASAEELAMFNQTQNNLAPGISTYGQYNSTLATLLGLGGAGDVGQSPLTQSYASANGQFSFDPTQIANNSQYQWQLGQGTQAVMNNLSSLGGVGGNALEALTGYGQGLASQNYNNYFTNALNAYNTNAAQWSGSQNQIYNMLAGQASAGQNAATNLGNQAVTVGGQVGSNIIGAGNAAAAGTVGATNSLTSGLNNYAMYNQLQQLQQSQGANLYNQNATTTNALGTV